jgi:DNA-binding transcriptional regulator YiaG
MQVLPRSAGGSDQINRAIIVETPLKPARARHFCEETMLSELPELNSRKIRDEVLSELHELDPAKLRAEVLREIREQLFLTPQHVAQILNISTECLERLDISCKGPTRLKLGPRTHRYSMKAVREWLRIVNETQNGLKKYVEQTNHNFLSTNQKSQVMMKKIETSAARATPIPPATIAILPIVPIAVLAVGVIAVTASATNVDRLFATS